MDHEPTPEEIKQILTKAHKISSLLMDEFFQHDDIITAREIHKCMVALDLARVEVNNFVDLFNQP